MFDHSDECGCKKNSENPLTSSTLPVKKVRKTSAAKDPAKDHVDLIGFTPHQVAAFYQ